MKYLEYTFKPFESEDSAELLIALLDEEGYEGFIQSDGEVLAYIQLPKKDEVLLESILERVRRSGENISFSVSEVPDKNWNEDWESSFQPIEVDNAVRIRASFHPSVHGFTYDLLIDPKMSFGTGHHATTRLMIRAMLRMDLKDRSVLDMGCGTGILGILALKMHATNVVAVDIDSWSCRNAKENAELNRCRKMEIMHGGVETVRDRKFDVLLANINRNVLLDSMKVYAGMIKDKGSFVLSGIMVEDAENVQVAAFEAGFELLNTEQEDQWLSCAFRKR